MWDLREQVVQHVRADVVVDLVEHAKVAVDRGQTAAQVAPLLRGRNTFSAPRRRRVFRPFAGMRYSVRELCWDRLGPPRCRLATTRRAMWAANKLSSGVGWVCTHHKSSWHVPEARVYSLISYEQLLCDTLYPTPRRPGAREPPGRGTRGSSRRRPAGRGGAGRSPRPATPR